MSASTDYPVYTGFWTNWSDGKVMGATLTLTRTDANLIIAFVAFFLTIITTRLWAIISFAFHALFSTPDPRDTLHHQRQVLLRNNGGPTGAAWALVRLAWRWRKGPRTMRRILPLLASTLLLAIGFTAAAGFSSRVSQGSEVLLVPQNCAYYLASYGRAESNTWSSWLPKLQTEAANYAQECYTDDALTTESRCINRPYVQQQLQMSINPNASCPFDAELCATPTSNLIVDTGLIDTHSDLGINAPKAQRAQFRTVLQCAPLAIQGHSEPFEYATNTSFTRYYYGPNALGVNYTHEYPNPINVWNLTENGDGVTSWWHQDYSMIFYYASPLNGSFNSSSAHYTFTPMLGLQRPDADVYLIFLSANDIWFRQPTADRWYNGSQELLSTTLQTYASGGEVDIQLWFATEPASPLACYQQEQWCLGGAEEDGGSCTPLSGYLDAQQSMQMLMKTTGTDGNNNTNWQRAAWMNAVMYSHSQAGAARIVDTLGRKSLTSRFTLNRGRQGPLADTQWQQDVEYWMSTYLALVQQSFVTAATGANPSNDSTDIHAPDSEAAETVCANQKIISQIHVSFSVFGLGFILFFGLLTITISFVLEPLSRYIQRRLRKNPYARLEWYATGAFQLQRLAHEPPGRGTTTWGHCADDIPVTAPGTLLAALDISDESHPVLLCTPDQGSCSSGDMVQRPGPPPAVTAAAVPGDDELTLQASVASTGSFENKRVRGAVTTVTECVGEDDSPVELPSPSSENSSLTVDGPRSLVESLPSQTPAASPSSSRDGRNLAGQHIDSQGTMSSDT